MALGRRRDRNSYGVPVRPAPLTSPQGVPAAASAGYAAPGGLSYAAPAAPPASALAGAIPADYAPWSPGQPLPSAPRRRRPRTRTTVASAIAVLVVVTVAWQLVQARGRFAAPSRLQGVAKATQPQYKHLTQQVREELELRSSGASTAAFYTSPDGRLRHVLIAVRGRLDVDAELRRLADSYGVALTEASTVDGMTCAEATGSSLAVCTWSGPELSGVVASLSGGLDSAAAAGREARGALD